MAVLLCVGNNGFDARDSELELIRDSLIGLAVVAFCDAEVADLPRMLHSRSIGSC